MELLQGKYLKLQNVLRSFPNLIVAYSGGVDSTFLLKVAFDVLGDKVLGIIGVSPSLPERELTSALEVAQQFHLPVKTIKTEELADDRYNSNPTNRCYFCKKVLFTELFDYARRNGFQYIADGTNADDENDFRPGKQAAKEFNIVSPLKEAGLTKADIRELSFQLHLPTWDKPEMACLASRFPTGTRITADRLHQIERAEYFLKDLGFTQIRVRYHGELARIEIGQEEFEKFLDEDIRRKVNHFMNSLGFKFVTLDLAGYRRGSLNHIQSGKEISYDEHQ